MKIAFSARPATAPRKLRIAAAQIRAEGQDRDRSEGIWVAYIRASLIDSFPNPVYDGGGINVAEQENIVMDLSELGKRVDFIEEVFRTNKISLRADSGLYATLEGARALAAGEKLPDEPSDNCQRAVAYDAHVIWALTDGLRACLDAGLNVRAHLTQLTTGTTDYGIRGEGHDIYFKDFECELFIAATFIRKSIMVAFSETPNDPLAWIPTEAQAHNRPCFNVSISLNKY